MFGSNRDKKTPAKGVPMGGSVSHNSLVKGTLVKGDVKSETDIRVDGTIEGQLDCDAKVVIGDSGQVLGSVTCRDAVIEGRVEGNVQVADMLNLRKTAQLNGNIETNKLIVEAGAIFAGNVSMAKPWANMPPENKRSSSRPVNDLARYSGIALQMAVVLGGFAYLGHWLDQRFRLATPWFTLAGCLIGLTLSMAQVLRQLNQRPRP